MQAYLPYRSLCFSSLDLFVRMLQCSLVCLVSFLSSMAGFIDNRISCWMQREMVKDMFVAISRFLRGDGVLSIELENLRFPCRVF